MIFINIIMCHSTWFYFPHFVLNCWSGDCGNQILRLDQIHGSRTGFATVLATIVT